MSCNPRLRDWTSRPDGERDGRVCTHRLTCCALDLGRALVEPISDDWTGSDDESQVGPSSIFHTCERGKYSLELYRSHHASFIVHPPILTLLPLVSLPALNTTLVHLPCMSKRQVLLNIISSTSSIEHRASSVIIHHSSLITPPPPPLPILTPPPSISPPPSPPPSRSSPPTPPPPSGSPHSHCPSRQGTRQRRTHCRCPAR